MCSFYTSHVLVICVLIFMGVCQFIIEINVCYIYIYIKRERERKIKKERMKRKEEKRETVTVWSSAGHP